MCHSTVGILIQNRQGLSITKTEFRNKAKPRVKLLERVFWTGSGLLWITTLVQVKLGERCRVD